MADTNSFWVDDAEQNAKDLFSPEALDKLDSLNEQAKHDPDLEPVVVEEEPHGNLGLAELPVDKMDWLSGEPMKHCPHKGDRGEPLHIHDECVLAEPNEIVVEEPVAHKDTIPGSDTIFVEEDKDGDKPVEPKTWEQHKDHSQFVSYVMDRKNKIPRHSGETIPGNERAKAYLKSLDNEISAAMRSDLDGVIDEQQIDAVRKEIEHMVERLDRQIDKLKKKTKKSNLEVRLVSEGQCEKCKSTTPMWHDVANGKLVCMHCEAEEDVTETDTMKKEAGTARLNVYISAFERAITGIIVDSSVSAGRDLEETYDRLDKQYNFTPREKLAIIQICADMGQPIFLDRGRIGEKDKDPSDGKGVDFPTQYYA